MKRTLFAFVLSVALVACGNSTDNASTETSTTIETDTTTQPGGVVNSNVISTDTAAMNMQNAQDKFDSINK